LFLGSIHFLVLSGASKWWTALWHKEQGNISEDWKKGSKKKRKGWGYS
jgi:hypothetical protein